MGTVLPLRVDVLVATRTIVVSHEIGRVDESSVSGPSQRGKEIGFGGDFTVDALGFANPHADDTETEAGDANSYPGAPANA